MIILDANILLYAYDEAAENHVPVRDWLHALLGRGERVGVPLVTAWAFLRISTNPRLLLSPLSLDRAFALLRDFLSHPRVSVVGPGQDHLQFLEEAARLGKVSGARLTDAVLAALAMEHGATLASTDRDFARFPGLRWINPLD